MNTDIDVDSLINYFKKSWALSQKMAQNQEVNLSVLKLYPDMFYDPMTAILRLCASSFQNVIKYQNILFVIIVILAIPHFRVISIKVTLEYYSDEWKSLHLKMPN